MSTLKATTIEDQSGGNITLGTTGDTVSVTGNTLVLDTWKDSGGNTLFTSDGSGTVSNMNSALSGAGPVLIQSQTASSSSSIEFTSGLDSTYDKYMFVFVNIHAASNGERLQFQVSTDGGSSYGVNIISTYFDARHKEDDSDTGLTYQPNQDLANSTSYQDLNRGMGTNNDDSHSGILYLVQPSSTTFVKHFYGTCNHVEHGVTSMNGFVSGYVNSASAVDAINFKCSSGNIDAGTFKLYGVK
jgi:hypothetical protein